MPSCEQELAQLKQYQAADKRAGLYRRVTLSAKQNWLEKETNMYAIAFETRLENGAIQVPSCYQSTLTGVVKVIILQDTPSPHAAV